MATGGAGTTLISDNTIDEMLQDANSTEQNHQDDVESLSSDLKNKASITGEGESHHDATVKAQNTDDATDGGAASGARKKKKKKKKDKPGEAAGENVKEDAAQPLTMPKFREFQKAMEMFVHQGPARSLEDAKKKVYNFWDTQPVPKLEEQFDETVNDPVEERKENIREEPYSLPGQFIWDTLDIHDPLVLQELYTLLNENYVEDDDNMFRFDYSANFLLWALTPPGWLPKWHCGVRVATNKKLVGFISAVPATIKIYEKIEKMVEINFLCVHKKLRSKRVAPVLIREITRRVNMEGIFQAVYTAGVVLPKPLATCSPVVSLVLHHVSQVLAQITEPQETGRCQVLSLGRIDTTEDHQAIPFTEVRCSVHFSKAAETKSPGLRTLEEKGHPSCHQLLTNTLSSNYVFSVGLCPLCLMAYFRLGFGSFKSVHSIIISTVPFRLVWFCNNRIANILEGPKRDGFESEAAREK
ncbi:putative glycylpeptide N-tetradecanoyltransferase 1 isoform X2 [Apostichopus japonicus]|uniref:glycylpeptide N-tetradecanoyltransferase n=1 Tax=Stichopus japonicus TaxID=307972 RepID=A0A2G8JQ10_STIJA|nr:putative glycylpeptide N-tetradecanoyltransferase 1 isoform X2 [Apostichopus japonicus]